MSGKGKSAFAMAVFLLITLNSSWAERVYEYEVTVGPGGSYDFETINEAIADVKDNRSTGDLACIWVYPGDYEEQLRDTRLRGHKFSIDDLRLTIPTYADTG